VVDEVVAVVGTRAGEARVITLSTVAEEGRIALVSRGGTEAAFAPLDGAVLRASLDWYVDQLLLHEEAVRLQVFEVDSAAVQAELARFRKEFRRPGDFQAFLYAIDATEEELSAILRRTLRVRRYLESRLGRLRASPAEVEAWYRANPEAVAGRSLDEVSDDIAARLATARADAEADAGDAAAPCARVETPGDLPPAWAQAVGELRAQIARLQASECEPMVLTLTAAADGRGARIAAAASDGRRA
jgi:hypothetical protein